MELSELRRQPHRSHQPRVLAAARRNEALARGSRIQEQRRIAVQQLHGALADGVEQSAHLQHAAAEHDAIGRNDPDQRDDELRQVVRFDREPRCLVAAACRQRGPARESFEAVAMERARAFSTS